MRVCDMAREARRKKRRKKRNTGLVVFLVALLLAVMAALIVWNVFTVEQVVVDGNELYDAEQIEQLVLEDEYSWNSLYLYLKYQLTDVGEIPFIDAMEVSLDDPHTVRVTVYEKGILGSFYIDAIGQNAYFDKDGFVVETSEEVREEVPRITGVSCAEVVLYEKIPLEQPRMLDELLALTQTLKKYDILPQEIHYDARMNPTLLYSNGISVVVGSSEYLTQKIVRLSALLPQVAGLKGTLYLDTWTPDTTDITFRRE